MKCLVVLDDNTTHPLRRRLHSNLFELLFAMMIIDIILYQIHTNIVDNSIELQTILYSLQAV